MNNYEVAEQLELLEMKLHVLYASMSKIATQDDNLTRYEDITLCGCGILFDEIIALLGSTSKSLRQGNLITNKPTT
jgi:hypothetical protein